jgi:hypothetical protein
MADEVYCRHCGMRLRRALGRWWHVQRLGPVPCPGAEPEIPPASQTQARHEPAADDHSEPTAPNEDRPA